MDIWIFILVLVLILGITSLFLLHDNKKQPNASGNDASGNNVPITTAIGQGSTGCPDPNGCPPPFIFMEDQMEKPYLQKPILDVDDYEYSLVFKNEGDRAITKNKRDKLMSQYPMDWTVQPPSSDAFQQGMAAYKESFENPKVNTGPNPFTSIIGTNMVPPDEQNELEILQTYTPKDAKSLTTYDAVDAKEIIERIYSAKGLKAEYKETGPNQFTVFSTSSETPVFEQDEAAATTGANTQINENTIVVPTYVRSSASSNPGLDPYFTPGQRARDDKWDYASWTPGLERMFAPMKEWS